MDLSFWGSWAPQAMVMETFAVQGGVMMTATSSQVLGTSKALCVHCHVLILERLMSTLLVSPFHR